MKKIVSVIVPLMLFILVFCILWQQGSQFGIGIIQIESELDTRFDSEDAKLQIYTACRRIKQGDKVALSDFAKACDVDGSDLSDKLKCYDEEGNLLSGFLDTQKPGIRSLLWEVESICTGRRIRKKMTVLVDGRV